MSRAAESGCADQHLGENLAALIDGELCHDIRDRVLAHLATCQGCKVEADAQRQTKNVCAESALPPPSEDLLARLRGLPATGPHPPSVFGEGAARGEEPVATARPSPFRLDLLVGGRERDSLLAPSGPPTARGFRIHETGGPRGHRGHRFAFAAAGAVSLAAFAIGGAATSVGIATGGPTATGSGPSVVSSGSGSSATGGSLATAGVRAGAGRTGPYGDQAEPGTDAQRGVPVALPSAGEFAEPTVALALRPAALLDPRTGAFLGRGGLGPRGGLPETTPVAPTGEASAAPSPSVPSPSSGERSALGAVSPR